MAAACCSGVGRSLFRVESREAAGEALELFFHGLLDIDGEIDHAVAQDAVAGRHFFLDGPQLPGRLLGLGQQALVLIAAPGDHRPQHVLDFLKVLPLALLGFDEFVEFGFVAHRFAGSGRGPRFAAGLFHGFAQFALLLQQLLPPLAEIARQLVDRTILLFTELLLLAAQVLERLLAARRGDGRGFAFRRLLHLFGGLLQGSLLLGAATLSLRTLTPG